MTTVRRVCEGRFSRWMQGRGWTGVTLPAPWAIYILYWGNPDLRTVRHEWAHVQQALRMGVARWWATYAWHWLRRGYRMHPMEIDARAAEGDA